VIVILLQADINIIFWNANCSQSYHCRR